MPGWQLGHQALKEEAADPSGLSPAHTFISLHACTHHSDSCVATQGLRSNACLEGAALCSPHSPGDLRQLLLVSRLHFRAYPGTLPPPDRTTGPLCLHCPEWSRPCAGCLFSDTTVGPATF